MDTYLIYFAIALAVAALLVLAFLAGRKWTGPKQLEVDAAAMIAHAALAKLVELQQPAPPLTAVEQAALEAKAAKQMSMTASIKALSAQVK